MSQILFRGTSIEKKKTIGYGFAIALGITGIALAVILLVAGRQAPEEAEPVIMISGPAGLVLLAWGIWLYFSVRGDMFITKAGNKYGITFVNSKKQKVIELYSPFIIKCYHDLQRVNKYQRAYFLYMLIYDQEGNLIVTLESGSAAIMGEPQGWKPLFQGDLDEVDVRYTCSHIMEAHKILKPFIK